MKFNKLTEAENTLSNFNKRIIRRATSEYIEIEDGFIHDARQFVHNIRLLDVANKKVFKKYQEYFQNGNWFRLIYAF